MGVKAWGCKTFTTCKGKCRIYCSRFFKKDPKNVQKRFEIGGRQNKEGSIMKKKKKWYTHEELHKKWMKDPEFRREYDALQPEFEIS